VTLTTLTRTDLNDILCGATLLGSGGGGPVWMGQKLIEQLSDSTITLIDPAEVDDEGMMGVVSFFGVPQILQQQTSLNYGAITNTAFQALAQAKSTVFQYVLPLETGGGNSFIPMTAAALNGIPIVDGDGAGRAIPSPAVCTLAVLPISPVVMARSSDEIITLIASNIQMAVSALLGTITSITDFTLGTGLAMWAVSGAQMKPVVVSGTISRALSVGRAIRLAQGDPVEAAVNATGGKLLFVGTVKSINIPPSFSLGTTVFTDGTTDVTVFSMPDNMLAWSSKYPAPITMAPDSICYMTPDGQTLSITELQALPPGQEVAILSVPAAQALRTSPFLDMYMGLLKSAGYGGPYVPVDTSRNRR
jgi:uncharacterized protein